MPKKAVPYLTVGFGTRPQRLRTPAGAQPYKPPTPQQRLRAMSKVAVASTPGAPPATKQIPLGNASPGRPTSNLGQYLIKPVDDSHTGFEMLNTEPRVLTDVNAQFMRRGHLPPALQPKYLRKPEVMDKQRATAISKGFRKPRSQQG